MKVDTFIHAPNGVTTMSEIKRIHDQVSSTSFLGVYAYATQSGVASFDLEMGQSFWRDTPSRWLFGIDYGRTQPLALRRMHDKQNTDIRVVDGAWVVNQEGFIPRRDFHAKMALLFNPDVNFFGTVVGSGNFSSNGLRKSIEAGTSVFLENVNEFEALLKRNVELTMELWDEATPIADILNLYEEKWSDSLSRRMLQGLPNAQANELREIFWIEAGYVTRNRGHNKPGNQIDFPRGVTARYFGFNPPDDLPRNSVIGPVLFNTPVGGLTTNNLRLGNNMMEKISLPVPETHGFDIYDGKILVFRRANARFDMTALEAADFEAAFGDRLDDVRVMGSGRRYGYIV